MQKNTRKSQNSPVIYLPSSGGFGGSRLAPELIINKRFPFRRYSIQEDGSLVVREKHANRDVRRSHPYTRPTVRFDSPPPRRASVLPDPETTSARPTPASTSISTSTSTSAPAPNPALTTEFLKSLVPALVEDPASFEESISSIFSAHNIDESIISAVTQAARRKSLNHSFERARTPDRSAPVLTSSSASAYSVAPIKQERPFSSGSPGVTAWYSSYSVTSLSAPPPDLNPNVGDLYIHNNRAEASHEVWLYGLDHSWMHTDVADKVYHPIIADRVLSMRANGTPSWITAASYTTIKGRKEKARTTQQF